MLCEVEHLHLKWGGYVGSWIGYYSCCLEFETWNHYFSLCVLGLWELCFLFLFSKTWPGIDGKAFKLILFTFVFWIILDPYFSFFPFSTGHFFFKEKFFRVYSKLSIFLRQFDFDKASLFVDLICRSIKNMQSILSLSLLLSLSVTYICCFNHLWAQQQI